MRLPKDVEAELLTRAVCPQCQGRKKICTGIGTPYDFTWEKCPRCKGTGIDPHNVLSEPFTDEIPPRGQRGEEGPRKAAGGPPLPWAPSGQQQFIAACTMRGLPTPVFEYPFAKDIGRRWRFDVCWVEQWVAVEVQGGLFSGGGHVRGGHLKREYEKLNAAQAIFGFKVMLFLPEQVGTEAFWEILTPLLQGDQQ